jgi:cation diffusion facilitator family transporter
MDTNPESAEDRQALSFAMSLSLAVGLLMFVIKVGAYLLTGSAAILSDAAESVVHVAAVIFAAYSLRLSYRPPDADHLYGHAKISFFSAGFEGAMIILAAVYILYESIHKWMGGLKLEHVGLGTALTAAAAAINGGLGFYLLRIGRRKNSLILQANGKHVLTDCWTSAAVLVGLTLVLVTGWQPFDPICGIVMAINILWSGGQLIRSASSGLMDKVDPEDHRRIAEILLKETQKRGLTFHQLRHRSVGDTLWVEVHLLFPEDVSLTDAHRMATEVEDSVGAVLGPKTYISTHLECAADHASLHEHGMAREP